MNDTAQISLGAAEWLVGCYELDDLFALVTSDPVLQSRVFKGGFKVQPESLKKRALRRRIAALLVRESAMAEGWLNAPGAPWAWDCEAVAMFDCDWLKLHWRDLIRGSGDASLVVGMAADPRPEIRRRGMRMLRRQSWWEARLAPDPRRLPLALDYFLDVSLHRAVPVSSAEAEPDAHGRLTALERENESLREAVERQRSKVRAGEKALKEMQQERTESERDLSRQIQEAQQALQQAEADARRRVNNEVNAFKRKLLQVPETEPEADVPVGIDELLGQVDHALQRQAELDERYGTREALRRRIHQLSEAAARLASCIEESVRLHPDIRRIHAQSVREMERLQESVQREVVETHTPELASQLIAEAKAVSPGPGAEAELSRIERVLEMDLIDRLLGLEGVERVRHAVEGRRELLREVLHEHSGLEQVGAALDEIGHTREIWDVRTALAEAGEMPVSVFVDGYNVIRRVAALAEHERRGGLAGGREQLRRLCRAVADRVALLEVVFDGRDLLSAREQHGGVTLVFSRGLKESQNADDYLVDRVAAAALAEGEIWLVTDDQGLRARAESCCDAFVSCEDWYRGIAPS